MIRIKGKRIYLLAILLISAFAIGISQQEYLDPEVKSLLDSLESQINQLQAEIPSITKTKDVSYYYKIRELNLTQFIKAFEEYVFEEDLDMAEKITLKYLDNARKRRDNYSAEIIEQYAKRLKKERKMQLTRYQKLFAKERNFKKEFHKYIKAGNDYSLKRARRMTQLALKYARQQNIQVALKYLPGYLNYINAIIYDYNSEYDLARLTRNEAKFQKEFTPLISSDSISQILKAKNLVDNCYHYAASTRSVLDTNFFSLQRNAVSTSISDYYERQGTSAELARLTGQSVVARLDTLNREGVYKWHDKIV